MLWMQVCNWLRREEGQDLSEYALLLGLIVIAAVVAVTALGGQISTVMNTVQSDLSNALN
jgi:Flp pilus assembly pilin Flp